MEVPVHEVGGRPADLTPVRAPPLRFPQVYGPEPLLPHDAAHDLLRDDQRIRRVPPQHGVDGAVSPHAPALLEQEAHPFAQDGVLVDGPHGRAPVIVGAAPEPHRAERVREPELTSDRVDDPRLLPARQPGGIQARVACF